MVIGIEVGQRVACQIDNSCFFFRKIGGGCIIRLAREKNLKVQGVQA
jgi:hypothetical protein